MQSAREQTLKRVRERLMASRWKILVAAAALAASPSVLQAQTTMKVVMHSDVKIVDPIWTTAYIVRNHGYMIYDTLFALDEKGDVKPQMVDTFTESPDKLTYKFTLRDGLLWHDGKPVTAEDCIASIKRWSARDPIGQKLMTFVDAMTADDAKSFTVKLKSPTGLLIFGLGKPSSNVPFMMPKRVAETDPNTQISEFIGSGPFVLKTDEWKPGDKIVYTKFKDYKPRSEPASGLAGGKVAKIDRVEWLAVSDQQQAVNALLAGEIDMIEQPSFDLIPLLKSDKAIKLIDYNPLGLQYTLRPNHTIKPFDNPKIRQALTYALNQKDFLDAVVGNPDYYKVCKAMFICGTPLATEAGMDGLLESNFKKSQELLKEAGYDGTPVVLLHSTDLQSLTNLAPVAKQLMEKGGFKVDMQSSDWQSVVARRVRKTPVTDGGWNAMLTAWVSADVLNPVMAGFFNASCDKAAFGWACDEQMEKLRDDFARATDPAKQKAITEAVQMRWREVVTHIHLGQYTVPIATRPNISGILTAAAPVFWNVEKK
jgi:peptide/nickel transport system substrate-binding protein